MNEEEIKEMIQELKNQIEILDEKIDNLEKVNHGLQADLDYQVEQNYNNGKMSADIRDLQEAVAKMSNEPVGMMFDYRA